jgi:hypothetical protein
MSFGVTCATLLVVQPIRADDGVPMGPSDVRSVFFVARSQNKNQVHYGVHLDAGCEPIGSQPVFGYWRMLDHRGEIEPILGLEMPAYGVADSQRIARNADSTTIGIRLRAFPERPLVVTVKRTNGRCEASASTAIAGADAQLHWIYVKLRWPFGIEHVLVRGWANADGRPVEELIPN